MTAWLIFLAPSAPAQAPAINSGLAVSGSQSIPFQYQIGATNSPTSYAATSLPAGLNFNSATGLIAGTPTVTGTFSVPISAINASGTGSATLNMGVAQPPPDFYGLPCVFTTLFSFSGTNGSAPWAAPVQGTDGNFYGTTTGGGGSNFGTLFRLTSSGSLTMLYSFSGTSGVYPNGIYPYGGVIQGNDGNLYGTTEEGGTNGWGTAFKSTTSGSFVWVYSFDETDGAYPWDGVVQGTDGNFYGTTEGGGNNGNNSIGTVFKITPGGSLTSLYTFNGNNNNNELPTAALTQGSDGSFYGTTIGTDFKITSSGSLTTLNTWGGSAFVQAGDGNFYGVGGTPGVNSSNVIFQMTPNGVITVTSTFNGTNGSSAGNQLAVGNDGNLYGTAYKGGSNNAGTIFEATLSGSLVALYNFSGLDGANPLCNLFLGNDGSFYGTTSKGGSYGSGAVFKLAPNLLITGTANGVSCQTFATGSPTGYGASGLPPGLNMNAATGLLSGTATATGTFSVALSATNAGGTGGATLTIIVPGTPYITSPVNMTVNEGVPFNYQIVAFNNPTSYSSGTLPAGLSLDTSAGIISGTPTSAGTFIVPVSATNANGSGSATLVIVILPVPVINSPLSVTGTTNVAFTYQITAGNNPTSYGANGLPTGLGISTSTGSITGTPTVSGTYTTAIDAVNSTGTGTAALTIAVLPIPAITSGGSAAAQLDEPFNYQITAINNPTSFSASGLPDGLSLNTATGIISGSATTTGTYTVSLTAMNSTETGTEALTIVVVTPPAPVITNLLTLASFSGLNGEYPSAGLIQASDGNFYGTTGYGGRLDLAEFGYGTVFQITPSGTLATIYAFGQYDGQNPLSALIQGSDGNFYGTTSTGGNGGGVIFRVFSNGFFYQTLCYFSGYNAGSGGFEPESALIQTGSNTFYGTTVTSQGGYDPYGTVYEMVTASNLTAQLNYVEEFNGSVGRYPYGGLLLANGILYGVAAGGGAYGDGTVFDINGSLQTFFTFNGTNGAAPHAGLIQGTDGNFYGSTPGGGNGYGTIFQLTPSGSLTTIYSFSGTDGANPNALFQASDGNFYGTTNSGGNNGDGTLYETTTSGSLTTIYNFSGSDGNGPQGALLQGSNGSFYGTTYQGGADNYGTAFEAVPSLVTTGTDVAFSYHILATNEPNSYTATGLPAGLSLDPGTGLITGTAGESGTFSVPISATNAGGTGSGTMTIVVVFPTDITSAPSESGTTGQAFSYQITAGNNPVSYQASGLPVGLGINNVTGSISGTPTASGTFDVIISAVNQSGTTSETLTIAVLPIPVITSAVSASGSDGFAFNYQIAATNNPTSFNATGLPAGLSVNTSTGLISGTLATSGTFSVNFTAADNSGSNTSTLIISIVLPPAPSITSPLTVTGTNGGPLNYQIAATYNPMSFGAGALPAGLNLSTATGLISGTPTVTGTFSVPISATNPGGTGNATLTVNLQPTPPPPSITSSLTVTGSNGVPFSYAIGATNSPVSYSASGLPSGLNVNTTTGLISGTASVTGTYSVPISATNFGGTANATLTINLMPLPAPVITNLRTILSFTGTNGTAPGSNPVGPLLVGSDTNLYGTTQYGGSKNYGTVFKTSTNGAYSLLTSFTGVSGTVPGTYPLAGLIQSGTLFFGTTQYGGSSNAGTVFEINSTGTMATLYAFGGGVGGGNPEGNVIEGSNTNYYLNTANGGGNNDGTMFEFNSRGLNDQILSFTTASGAHPEGPLLLADDGYFYGTANTGGTGNYGTVYKITPSTLSVVCSFSGSSGIYPTSGLVQGSDGNFYGTLSQGGNGYGSVFQLTPSGSLNPFFQFNNTNGQMPLCTLAQGIDGSFYGTAEKGGNGYGVIFSVTPGTAGAMLFAFSGTNGGYPAAGLVRSSDGNSFYGTTSIGGSNNDGTVFQFYAPNVTASVGKRFTYPIIAVNYPASYSAMGLPPGISVNATTGLISGTATTSGTYGATISAINTGGTANSSLNFTVVSGVPVVTGSTTAQAGLNVGFGYQTTASNLPTSYSASGLPIGVIINPITGAISGLPISTGTYTVTIQAINAGGSGTEQLTIFVVTQPSITGSLSVSGTQNSPFSYQIVASNSPSGYSATGLPPDLSVDPVAGMISGTPSETGTYSVTLSATNAAGVGSGTLTLVLQSASPGVPGLPIWGVAALASLLILAGSIFLPREWPLVRRTDGKS